MNDGLRHMVRHGLAALDATRLFDPACAAMPVPPDEPDWVVPLATWNAHRSVLQARRHPVGIRLLPDDKVSDLADLATRRIAPEGIAFISVLFPLYTDGRGFSLAQIVRREYGWTGELRAIGDVLVDTVHYLARCGFDSFVLKDGHPPLQALKALQTFSASYQRSYAPSR
ncbi:MAG: hypothetical protein JWP52_3983 [Rhizobacter sp.]|nr:hypothetical protein [Rhizobacter sp.]